MLNIDTINLLVSCPNIDGGFVQIKKGKSHKIDTSGTTGLCYFNNKLIRSIQNADFAEFLVYNDDNSYISIIHRELRDIHDLLVFNDLLYVVSTGTNEVVALDASYKIQKRYKFDGEGDAWHLNCLVLINDRVCVSAFCNFKEHYNYKGKTLNSGFLLDIESEMILIDKLSQPHSPKFDGEHLYICDSEKKSLKKFDVKNNLINEISFGSYTRGICIDGNNLYVGLSKSRNIDDNSEEAQILVLDKNSFDILGKILIPSSEIYNIELFDKQELLANQEIISFYTATTVHQLQQELQKVNFENEMLKKLTDIAKLDAEYYLAKNEDIRNAGVDPFKHYYFNGKKEGRIPNLYCEYHNLNISDIVSTEESFYIQAKQIEGLSNELHTTTQTLQETLHAKAELEQEKANQAQALQTLNAEYAALQEEKAQLGANLDEVLNDLANVKEAKAQQKAALENQIAHITNELQTTTQTLQKTTHAKAELEQAKANQAQALQTLNAEYAALQEEKAQLGANLDEVLNDLANVKEAKAQQKAALENQIAHITNELQTTTQTLQETTHTKAELEQAKANQAQALQTLNAEYAALQEEKAQLGANLDEVLNDLANVKEAKAQQKAALENQIAQIANELQTTTQTLQETTHAKAELEQALQTLNAEHAALQEEKAQLGANLDEVLIDLIHVKEVHVMQKRTFETQIVQIKQELQEALQAKVNFENIVMQQIDKLQQNALAIQELQTQKEELADNYNQKLSEIETLNANLDEIVNDLANIKESKCWIYTKPIRDLQKVLKGKD